MIDKILQENLIIREFYFDHLIKYFWSPLIKVLTGMRRVGKSSILKTFICYAVEKQWFPRENIFYINKELFTYRQIQNSEDLYQAFKTFLQKRNPEKRFMVAIDEVQDIQEWERFINSCLAEYQGEVEIIITGSNAKLLSSDLTTYLSGRYIEFEIFPLSFQEYLQFSKQAPTKELFWKYLKFWWLPGIFALPDDEKIIFEYLTSVYNTILLKDVVKHFKVRNIGFVEDLYRYLLGNIGHLITAKNISNYLKSQRITISTEIILNYLNYSTKVFLFSQVKSENPMTKKFFEIYNKYYCHDLWMRNAIVWYDGVRDIGNLLENYVFLQLKRNGYQVLIGRLSSEKEIDFIAIKQGIIKYFQVTYLLNSEETIMREFSALEQIQDNWEKYVVSFDDINLWIHNGIQHINIMDIEKHL